MRTLPQASGPLRARAIAGSRTVLFGFDLTARTPDFLGFALHRNDIGYLPNFLRFAANDRPDGPAGTDANPLQAFQWGDYTVEPGTAYTYTVTAVYEGLRQGDSVVLEVRTEDADDGHHAIYFNRGVAGSQAYARRFNNVSPLENPEAATWMSRGLEEALIAFIAQADGPQWALHGALYEFIHAPVLDALHKAARAGADVKLSVACPSVANWPDYPAWHNIEAIRAFRGSTKAPKYAPLSKAVKPRRNARDIPHNKFLVLLRDGAPVAVWTGSTNITAGALWGHSNVGHAVTEAAIAQRFHDYWQVLFDDEAHAEVVAFNEAATPLDGPVVFSPRANLGALDFYRDLIAGARQSVFITAAFGLPDVLLDQLGQPSDLARYVLLESRDKGIMDVLKVDSDNRVAAGAYLGAKGGWHQFLTEQLTGLNEHVRYVHTKYLLIDPLTDSPTVVTGSANWSANSTTENDENMLVIRGDTRVADIYLGEFMRLFTHMRFRGSIRPGNTRDRAPDPHDPDVRSPKHLSEDGTWAERFFVPDSPASRERVLFSG